MRLRRVRFVRRSMVLLVMGKSIWIDLAGRIVMKNFDSVPVPQLQRFSYVRASLCCKIASWLTFASMSTIASAKAISSSVAMRAGRWRLRWTVQQLQDQSPEPLVWTVEGDSDRAINRIELNQIDSFVTLNRIESFSFFVESPIISYYVTHWLAHITVSK